MMTKQTFYIISIYFLEFPDALFGQLVWRPNNEILKKSNNDLKDI